MAKTLLAVDDSVTMRKVLEITFSGEDFHVITAENSQSALGKLGEHPGVFVVDTVLGGEDGYALAKELRKRSPGAPIILLASRYAPYDQARGRDAGADDFADKPFDTQQLIDKVRKAVIAKEAGGAAAAAPSSPQVGGAPPPAAGAPYRAPSPPQAPPLAAQATHPSATRGTQPSLGGAAQGVRSGTLVFGESPHAPYAPHAPAAQPPAVPPRPAPAAAPVHAAPPIHAAPAAHAPAPAPAHAPAPSPTPAAVRPTASAAMGAAVNGQLAGKLGELGLTPAQADAVLALSREVVERVVWEVVPQLAETMIKEEITRLTKG